VKRAYRRIPMEVGVQISGHYETPGVETTFTEDVSPRGARVLTSRRWQAEDRLTISTLLRDFEATARVAYCHAQRGEGYVIGLELLEPAGTWVVRPEDSGSNLTGS
jgi:hypothetical protein